jgi:UDP-N-acetyl-D-glucosamine dehydrogenase
MKVAVIGLGYVGSSLADAASSAGHELIGIDLNPSKIEVLSQRVSYQVSQDYGLVVGCDVVVIAVPTPLDSSRQPDISFVESAVEGISKYLSEGTLVINESTSYPGTLRNLIAGKLGQNYLYASAPERVDPGNTKWNTRNTPRIVGGLTEQARNKARDFYLTFTDTVHLVSTPEVAEAAKLFENTFRQVNIALVNEFAQVAHALGISTFETLEAAATKPFGFMPFIPSVGVGGHCIPVDPSYLSHAANRVGLETKFINHANEVNLAMPDFVASRIESSHGASLKGVRIQVAGISYKADISDLRESPAIALIASLRRKGAEVQWHDDLVGNWGSESSNPISEVDIGVIVTAHSGVDYSAWKNGRTMVIDVSTSPNTGWPKFL